MAIVMLMLMMMSKQSHSGVVGCLLVFLSLRWKLMIRIGIGVATDNPLPFSLSHTASSDDLSLLVLSLTQKECPASKVTKSAHPARFSPDDKFSRQRVACKKRFGLYLPDQPAKPM